MTSLNLSDLLPARRSRCTRHRRVLGTSCRRGVDLLGRCRMMVRVVMSGNSGARLQLSDFLQLQRQPQRNGPVGRRTMNFSSELSQHLAHDLTHALQRLRSFSDLSYWLVRSFSWLRRSFNRASTSLCP